MMGRCPSDRKTPAAIGLIKCKARGRDEKRESRRKKEVLTNP
jgi:hypothetical protein